jgi:opacity protein-like surface antigen
MGGAGVWGMPPVNVLVLAAAAAVASSSLASAQEMPLRAFPPAPVLDPWTGFFVGGNIGGGIGNKQLYDIFPTPDFALDANTNVGGWVGGFQYGYNYQVGWLVVGAEGNFDWSGINSKFDCFTFGDQKCTINSEWFGTGVGRVGATIGPALIFVDGGAAFTRDTLTDVATVAGSRAGVPALPGDLFSGSQIRPGWTIGGGVEYMLSHNWSVRADYNFMNFGERPITLVDGLGNFFPEEVKQTIQLITVGFDYRFNGSGLLATSPILNYADPALAYDDPPQVFKAAEPAEAPGATIRGFSAFDVSRLQAFGLVGGDFALTKDLDSSGPRLWLEGDSGWYKFGTSTGPISGVFSAGTMLAGYAFEGDNYEINLLAGGYAENDMLSGFDQTDPVKGTAAGPKVRADVWVNPTPQTLFYSEGEYSTAFQTYWTSAKWGYDVTNGKQIYVGPEVFAFGDLRFDQWRIGAHISEVTIGKVKLAISAGFAHDSVEGSGAYTHLEATIEF